MHYSGTLLSAAPLSVTSDRYERCCDVLRWNEGLDEWGRLSQDGSIVCLSGDGVVGVLDLPISTLKSVKGGGKLGQWGAECQSVNSSTWSNLPPPITLASGGRFAAQHPGSQPAGAVRR